jgi:hypothetical protein
MNRIRTSRWVWLWLMLSAFLALVLAGVLVHQVLQALAHAPVSVVIDGRDVTQGLNLAGMPPAHKVVLTLGLSLALLAALVIVPAALLAMLLAVAATALLALGLPLIALAAVLAIVLSPVILLVWGVIWALRRAAQPSATMTA